jgi:hypothetical protein
MICSCVKSRLFILIYKAQSHQQRERDYSVDLTITTLDGKSNLHSVLFEIHLPMFDTGSDKHSKCHGVIESIDQKANLQALLPKSDAKTHTSPVMGGRGVG